ncbi:AKAP7 2'5' RNA ligase-like domain-containing protein [Glomus cerebriforme]|uniref:AKAP7 2'5' RNA ligase-like domain-containing protein n=1 Tax=Glomus cerebriforme TaxID=658196 RepID=A0A397TC19_9GLOM|nr:AKAP7 2'5' RNA ligase-like domain-containing protein [Glomus cerebriforme]
MEESNPELKNNKQYIDTSIKEEISLAFNLKPENQQLLSASRKKHESRPFKKTKRLTKDDESTGNGSDEIMSGKIGTNLLANATLTLAKSSVKVKKARPNYFLSVRLDSQGIQENFYEFFNYVTKKFPEYKKMLITPQQIHITLFVLHLGNEDNIRDAKNCLLNNKEITKEFFPSYKPSLHFQGIDVFNGGRVVYTRPENSDGLATFTEFTYALHEKFQQQGLVDNDIKKEFKPHATLMKLKGKTVIKHKHGKNKEVIKRIPSEIYEHFMGFDFGTHCLESVELSSMLLPKGDDGYYIRLENIEL